MDTKKVSNLFKYKMLCHNVIALCNDDIGLCNYPITLCTDVRMLHNVTL